MMVLKKVTALMAALSVAAAYLPITGYSEEAVSFYVSVSGNDSADGSLDSPFQTLDRAKQAVSEYKSERGLPENGITVYIREGEYYRDSTFSLGEQDSGEEGKPITYKAYNDENVRILGAKKVDTNKFTKVTDADTLKRIPPEARGDVYSLDLSEQGEFEFGVMKQFGTYYISGSFIPNVYISGEQMTLARWPDEGYVLTGTVIDPGSSDDPLGTKPADMVGATFKYADDRATRWKTADDGWLYGYLSNNWSVVSVKIKSIDEKEKTITTVDSATFGVSEGNRYYAFNMLEELSTPGEWYYDRKTQIFYLYPPEGFVPGDEMIISQLDDALIEFNSCHDITLEGITVECGKGYLLDIDDNSKNILVNGCTIKNSGGRAVNMYGRNNGITNCDIYNTNNECIGVGGGIADNESFELAANYIINCDLHNFGQQNTAAPGILLRGHGQIIRNNRIHAGPGQAISGGGFFSKIEYNEIYDVLRETEDAGAIYNGRSSQNRGMVIANNYIHDIYSEGTESDGTIGIYLDDYEAGVIVRDNILYNVSSPIFGHHGSQNIIENNIIVNKTASGNGSIWWSDGGPVWAYEEMKTTNSSGKQYYDTHTAIDWTKEPYATYFPDAVNVTPENCLDPFDNSIMNNLIVNHSDLNIAERVWELSTIENNLFYEYDPGFVDLENENFALRSDSEVYEKIPDFRSPDMSKIGLYYHEDRPTNPERAEIDNFTLISPADNAEYVAADETEFAWNVCARLGIDHYRLIIAKDEDFENIVFERKVSGIKTEIKSLDTNERYWWKVEAVDKNGTVYKNTDGPASFKTTYLRADQYTEPPKYKELKDFYNDAEGWKQGSAKSITVTAQDITIANDTSGVSGYEGEFTDYNTLYHFGIGIDGGSWAGLAVHAANTDTLGWVNNSHYLVIIKPDMLEIHKYPQTGKSQMISSVARETPFDGSIHDIVFGTYRLGSNTHILFSIDGEIIYNIKDSYGEPLTKDGYFAVYTVGSEDDIQTIKLTEAVGEIPEITTKLSDMPDEYTNVLEGGIALKAGSENAYADLIKKQIMENDADAVPVIKNSTALVPIRFISENLGAEVIWNEEAKSVTVKKGEDEIAMVIGKETFNVNGEEKTLDYPPEIINDLTYLPIRAVSEMLGFNVSYNDSYKLILITDPEKELSENEEWYDKLNTLF